MPDALEQVLRLVADGRITAEQAAPILDALDSAGFDEPSGSTADDGVADVDAGDRPAGDRPSATSIRIEVTEAGRKIVNLRVPVALGRLAMERIPGLSGANADLVRRALAEGRSGTLLHIDDGGDGVRIALE